MHLASISSVEEQKDLEKHIQDYGTESPSFGVTLNFPPKGIRYIP